MSETVETQEPSEPLEFQEYPESSLADIIGGFVVILFIGFALVLCYLLLGGSGVIAGTIIGATLYLGGKLNKIIQLLEKNTITDVELPLK